VLSGNRNFEGRIHPSTKANYLASPPLVICYAIVGRVDVDFEEEPLGYSTTHQKNIYLKDIWPTRQELHDLETTYVIPEMFSKVYEKLTVSKIKFSYDFILKVKKKNTLVRKLIMLRKEISNGTRLKRRILFYIHGTHYRHI
jgi:aconitase A